jgi:hypothetical protein
MSGQLDLFGIIALMYGTRNLEAVKNLVMDEISVVT